MSTVPISFWGLTVEPGKSYTQVVEENFFISMAALGAKLPKNGTRSCITITIEDKTWVLCALTPGTAENLPLNIHINAGEEITLSNTGNCPIDLTGNHMYLLLDDEDDEEIDSELEEGSEEEIGVGEDGDESEEESDISELDEEAIEQLLGKRPAAIPKSSEASKKAKIVEIEDAAEEEEEESDEDMESQDESDEQDENEQKAVQKQPVKQEKKKQEKKETKKPEPKQEEKQEEKKSEGNKKTLPSGLIIEDSKIGNGPRAKNGKKVSVRYIGKLQNGKVFDSNTKGAPFTFKLGKGEVIKGWDIGVQGMNVGGTRKLTIPAKLAYGSRGAPPDIPPNSTLLFEVKLLEVKQ